MIIGVRIQSRIGGWLAIAPAFLIGVICAQAQAAPIELVSGTINMFRDTRGANNIGIGQGNRLQYGANIVGGSDGTTVGATYPPTGFVSPQTSCQPLLAAPNFCSNSTGFNAGRIAAPWTLRFERLGESPVVVAGPALAGTEVPVPFPVNVTITGSGVTPTISWTIPGGFVADAVRINVFDRGIILPNGQADLIHSFAVAGSLGSYDIPATLSSGSSLEIGGDYVFNVQLVDTRGSGSVFVATNNNAEILRRSSSFFNFTPLEGGGPPEAFLPTVVDGVYNFSITDVGPDSVTFIDPFVAVGYDYAIGAGDPNFASVLLPMGIGDNVFDLYLWTGLAFVDSGIDLTGGSQHFFGGPGVDRFSIRGIEVAAGLDPDNVTAFITGLTFVSAGDFTGTMTPIVVEVGAVPEPTSIGIIAAGLISLAWLRRRNGSPSGKSARRLVETAKGG
jgi:hypothetical protein